jgi:hypothetical protein
MRTSFIVTLVGVWLTSAVATFRNGEVMNDKNGNIIQAHQPHIFKEGSTYYWYGVAQVAKSSGKKGAVNLYTSSDLSTWTPHGIIFQSSGYVARVSMLGRNPETKQYTLWAKGGKDLKTGKGTNFQVATSNSLTGKFQLAGAFDAPGAIGDDMQAFKDPHSENAFLVYTQKGGHYQIQVLKLDDRWTGFGGEKPHQALPTTSLEAPAPFYSSVAKRFYIWCSHTSGWTPNAALVMSSSQGMLSPFKSVGNPTGSKTTFSTQGSHVLPLKVVNGKERFLYMGDRYEGFHGTSEGSRYIFLPMEVHSDGKIFIGNEKSWDINKWPTFAGNTSVEVNLGGANATHIQV